MEMGHTIFTDWTGCQGKRIAFQKFFFPTFNFAIWVLFVFISIRLKKTIKHAIPYYQTI